MKWDKATDKQLQMIIRYDIDCPHSLLSGAVAEMLNRGLLDGLVKKTIMSQFNRIEIAVKVLKVAEEDIFQFCRMKIFESINKYKQGMKSFLYFAFVFLKSELKDLELKAKAEKRKVYVAIQSIDTKLDSGDTFASILPGRCNVEKEVIRKISLEEKLRLLTDRESKCFLLYMEGYNGTEIAKRMNVTRRTAEKNINAALTKMSGKVTSIKKLGLMNYVMGA